MKQMRIDKLLSQTKGMTRTEAKKSLRAGRVTKNGIPIKDGAEKCDPGEDELCLDGEQIIWQEFHYLMLYKPSGCVTATQDAVHKTVMDYIPTELRRGLSPVGRLDIDTEGLLLLTDDGALNHQLLSPGRHVAKCYEAVIDGPLTQTEIQLFSEGLDIGEKHLTAPAGLEIISDETGRFTVLVTITEGKFHQIKRMFEAVGRKVLFLKRLSMKNLCLDENLQPGEWRPLNAEEIASLKETPSEQDAAQ